MLNRKKPELAGQPNQKKYIRLWPGVAAVILQWLIRFVVPLVIPDAVLFSVFGVFAGGLAVIVWWAFFSRALWYERWGIVVFMIGAMALTPYVLHESIATGNMGLMFFIFAIPVMSLAFVVSVVAGHRLSDVPRRVIMITAIIIVCVVWTLLRSDGLTGDFTPMLTWRWEKTHEEMLLPLGGDEPITQSWDSPDVEPAADWSGFRGPHRDGIVHNVRIQTDWSATPPMELWRQPIGPGCSSFAARGGLLYTQEQRGEDEIVSCYRLTTGKLVWKHSDTARFWDSHAGAGPRGTPTLSNNRIYSLGATGILNVLDAYTGDVLWTRNVVTDTRAEDSGWGITSSPLVVDDIVVVATVGILAAYDLATGEPRWCGPDGGDSYSSPHLCEIDGVPQILLMSGYGAASFAPADGTLLWEYPWKSGTRIVQPALAAAGEILMSKGDGAGMRRIAIAAGHEEWTIKELWSTTKLRPNFNDFVVHKGHAFGYNDLTLVCIDAKDGKRMWNGERYGGQIILFADQDLLLVLSEKGELVLIPAVPDQFTELARFPAIQGKTWNHPALAGDILVVRNCQEMAAFRLPLTGG